MLLFSDTAFTKFSISSTSLSNEETLFDLVNSRSSDGNSERLQLNFKKLFIKSTIFFPSF